MSNRRTFVTTMGLAPMALAPGQSPATAPEPALDIFQAAYKGDITRATELVKLNPAIARLRSNDGLTPLHYAVAGGQSAMITFLTTQGADLSAGPESPLLTAVDYPDHTVAAEMTFYLVYNASDPNVKRADGRSAIEIASDRGYKDVVEMLVHRGATGSLADSVKTERVYFGKRYSFDRDGKPYVPENLEGIPQDFINDYARLSHFDVERVKHLTKLAPALVFARATWDEMGIEAAAHMGLVPLAQFLADRGAPVSTCTATVLGLHDRVEALVKSDPACVRERGAHDICLLAYTAYGEERADIADFLLRSGAGVDARGLGATALHLAANKGYMELAEVLIKFGADVNATTKANATPLAIAVKAKKEKMVDFLKSRGARS